MAAAPQIGAAVITAPPAVDEEVRVAEFVAADASLFTLLSADAAALLMLLNSLIKLLFAGPVAVAATELMLKYTLEASLCAAEIALPAKLVPLDIAPPA
jgi:hypothetical protein